MMAIPLSSEQVPFGARSADRRSTRWLTTPGGGLIGRGTVAGAPARAMGALRIAVEARIVLGDLAARRQQTVP